MDLRLVTLHKSLPQEWPFAFRQAVNGRSRVSYDRRSQLKDIVDGLSSRCARDASLSCSSWQADLNVTCSSTGTRRCQRRMR